MVFNRHYALAGTIAIFTALIAGCVVIHPEDRWHPYPPEPIHAPGPPPHAQLGIPPGHLPPPGECRIWYPGEPPGQQPPPGPCYRLSREVPPGAWLVSRPLNRPGEVHVNIYDAAEPHARVAVRIYDAESGAFIEARIP